MLLTIVIGFFTVVPFTLSLMFSVQDLEAVANSPIPIVEVFMQTTASTPATILFVSCLFTMYFSGGVACFTTAGRLAWAFARDDGLPFSKFFAKVHPTLEVPVNATLLCSAFVTVYCVIYIGSTTAFNSILNMCILSLYITYAIPQGIVLFRGRDKALPVRSLRLGRLGPFVNGFSCLYVSLYTVLFCFPVFLPTTAASMNYVSAVLVVILVIVSCVWFGGKRNTFVGPVRKPYPLHQALDG